MTSTRVKVCPNCGEHNREWQEHCQKCQAILVDVYSTFSEILDIPPVIDQNERRTATVDSNPAAASTAEIERSIREANQALEHRAYQSAIDISTKGLAASWSLHEIPPGLLSDYITFKLILHSIRVTGYFATGETENWDKALIDIGKVFEWVRLYRNFSTKASQSIKVMENIRDVIEKRRHTEDKPIYY